MAAIIAGERSGAGKTTVTLALLSYYAHRGEAVQSYKVGPDYIDPMFHARLTGRPCRNLDPVLTSEAYVRACFARHTGGASRALVEGVMGLFDGIGWGETADFASTAHIARLLDLPVILVLDCSRLSGSVAALAHGYCSYDPHLTIAGVVLNRAGSDRHLERLRAALVPLALPVLGAIRRQDAIALPDRHLGLVPTEELEQWHALTERLAHLARDCFDWSRLEPLLRAPAPAAPQAPPPAQEAPVQIALARDRAFSFYYPDNLELLQRLGAQLLPWSPLQDRGLPQGTQGLYFGGGFPEVFVRQLADNRAARQSVRAAIQAGLPTYAECGGLMYLGQQIADFDGRAWPMVGALPVRARMTQRLTLGYRQATAARNTFLLGRGEQCWGHEFHRSQLAAGPTTPIWQLAELGTERPPPGEGWPGDRLHASYLHLHWGAAPALPQRFLHCCRRVAP